MSLHVLWSTGIKHGANACVKCGLYNPSTMYNCDPYEFLNRYNNSKKLREVIQDYEASTGVNLNVAKGPAAVI